MPSPAKQPSRDYFDARFQDLARHFTGSLGHLVERVDKGFGDVDQRLDSIDKQFVEVNAKLDAIMEIVAVRQEVRNLVQELRAKGIEIDPVKILLT